MIKIIDSGKGIPAQDLNGFGIHFDLETKHPIGV